MMTDSTPSTPSSTLVPPVLSLSAMAITMRNRPATQSHTPSRMAMA